jgi:hypothetical protein
MQVWRLAAMPGEALPDQRQPARQLTARPCWALGWPRAAEQLLSRARKISSPPWQSPCAASSWPLADGTQLPRPSEAGEGVFLRLVAVDSRDQLESTVRVAIACTGCCPVPAFDAHAHHSVPDTLFE